MTTPIIIQGGMGIGISGWRLAKAVSKAGQLGVVSGTSIDHSFIRRLQDGDLQGDLRRAMRHFPNPSLATKVKQAFFIPNGKDANHPYKRVPMYAQRPDCWVQQVTVLANFVEVWLAKENHQGLVGINLLEKVQLPNLASIYGAMLAGVDYVLMGAGIPKEIPAALKQLAVHKRAYLTLHVEDTVDDEAWTINFEPSSIVGAIQQKLEQPRFLPIVASTSLARFMTRIKSGQIDGLIIEGPSAGGHNAPPRGSSNLNDRGEPLYGARDRVDLNTIASLGYPFWLAGSYSSHEKLLEAWASGATGVQVGTAFAFCSESGMDQNLKHNILRTSLRGGVDVFTDPVASPTGFPFKVARLPNTLSEGGDYKNRKRVCDLGYLRSIYRKPDGELGYRCAAEPVEAFLKKGGIRESTCGRKCLCNALMANINLGQTRPWGYVEQTMQTTGDGINELAHRFCKKGLEYDAADVIDSLLKRVHDWTDAPVSNSSNDLMLTRK